MASFRSLFGIAYLTSAVICSQTVFDSSTHPQYKNRVYEFEVELPPHLKYERTMPPNPDHGIGIDLSDSTKLWVDASYTDSSTAEEDMKTLTAGGQVTENKPALLGGKPAILAAFSCAADAYDKAYQERLVLSVRRKPNRSRTCFQIGIRTYIGSITAQENELFEKLIQGFRYTDNNGRGQSRASPILSE